MCCALRNGRFPPSKDFITICQLPVLTLSDIELFWRVTRIKNRKASLTDSAFGNTSATSGANRTNSPNPLLFGPIFLTRKLFKSYSGRSSSSILLLSFFISILFCFRFLAGNGRSSPPYFIHNGFLLATVVFFYPSIFPAQDRTEKIRPFPTPTL